jgi:serine/threonine-protein kinase
VLADNLATDPAFRERFVREARLAARLSHRNVVQVLDVGEDERPFIVMELVSGGTLATALTRGAFDPARVADVARQAAAGLAHAHQAGLVHRDIKPGNLLVADDGTVKIGDFGIARAADTTSLTQTGAVLGTAAYLAPEQAAGRDVTAAADVYGLGMVLFEAATGRRATADAPATADELSTLDGPLATAILGALRADPAQRPTAGEIEAAAGGAGPESTAVLPTAAAALPTGALAAETVPLAAAGSTEVLSAARRPRPPIGAVLAAIAAVVIIGGALIANRHHGAKHVTATTPATAPAPPTTVAPTTTASTPTTTDTPTSVVVPAAPCGDITVGNITIHRPASMCGGASGATGAGADGADAVDAPPRKGRKPRD